MFRIQQAERVAGVIRALWWGDSILNLQQMKLKWSWLIMPYTILSSFPWVCRYPSVIAAVWGIHFLFHQRAVIKQRLRHHVHAVIYRESGPHFIFFPLVQAANMESKLIEALGNYKLRFANALVELSCEGNKLTTPIIYSFSCLQPSNSLFFCH